MLTDSYNLMNNSYLFLEETLASDQTHLIWKTSDAHITLLKR